VLEKQTDIQDQLSSGPLGLDVSREELEAELEDMMREDTEKKQPELSIDDIISGFSGRYNQRSYSHKSICTSKPVYYEQTWDRPINLSIMSKHGIDQ